MRDLHQALQAMALVVKTAPAAADGPSDALRLGRLHVRTGQYDEAIGVYRALIRRFPGSPEDPQARLELVQVLLTRAKSGDGDGQFARQARTEAETLQARHAGFEQNAEVSRLLGVAREQMAETLYQLGEFYTVPTHRRVDAARRYLYDVVRQYPDTVAAAKAKVLLLSLPPETPAGPDPAAVQPDTAGSDRATTAPSAAVTPARQERQREQTGKWLRQPEDLRGRTEPGETK
jgi:tetratricopeptide (TPR) repeat protein